MKGAELKHDPSDWKKVRNPEKYLRIKNTGAFRQVFYTHSWNSCSDLNRTRILFFSDLHLRPQSCISFFPGKAEWNNHVPAKNFLRDFISEYRPDHLISGGDLMAYLCNFQETTDLLASISCDGVKAGVYGNWDLMKKWLPQKKWKEMISQQGNIQILENEALVTPDNKIRFYGLDEYRKGAPFYQPQKQPQKMFECVIAHNPDTIPETLTEQDLAGIDLILCGHTHGGQIRIPGFGAVMTSSIHWKKFEYGLYQHRKSGTRLFISAGMGMTFIRRRFFCPPEALLIEICGSR